MNNKALNNIPLQSRDDAVFWAAEYYLSQPTLNGDLTPKQIKRFRNHLENVLQTIRTTSSLPDNFESQFPLIASFFAKHDSLPNVARLNLSIEGFLLLNEFGIAENETDDFRKTIRNYFLTPNSPSMPYYCTYFLDVLKNKTDDYALSAMSAAQFYNNSSVCNLTGVRVLDVASR
ncbi:MAG: hypothetical protein FWC68_04445 [Oscillospiraceae bacterium]|nr:hypothetical protein [Oscillospiraceae bacterium]